MRQVKGSVTIKIKSQKQDIQGRDRRKIRYKKGKESGSLAQREQK